MIAGKHTMIEESLCLFEPAWALAEWERGNLSPESRSQIETLVSFLDVDSPRLRSLSRSFEADRAHRGYWRPRQCADGLCAL
jgi:hypothetical protein